MKLKCAFRVRRHNFELHNAKEGIKHLSEKVQDIIDMKPSRGIEEVQRLNGGIVVLNRFIPRSTNKCQ